MSIKEIRLELGLKQTAFAKLFGVHQTAVSQWETGRTSPDLDTVIKISRATGYSINEILGVDEARTVEMNAGDLEIRMPDDSMHLSRILKGDRVYVRSTEFEMTDGKMVGVRISQGNTVRYLRIIGGEKYLETAELPSKLEKVDGETIIFGPVYAFSSQIV